MITNESVQLLLRLARHTNRARRDADMERYHETELLLDVIDALLGIPDKGRKTIDFTGFSTNGSGLDAAVND